MVNKKNKRWSLSKLSFQHSAGFKKTTTCHESQDQLTCLSVSDTEHTTNVATKDACAQPIVLITYGGCSPKWTSSTSHGEAIKFYPQVELL